MTSRKTTENNGTSCVRCEYERSLKGVATAQDSTVETVPMADKSTAVSQVDLMFRAFCDRTRLRILSLLQDGELCVGDIVESLQFLSRRCLDIWPIFERQASLRSGKKDFGATILWPRRRRNSTANFWSVRSRASRMCRRSNPTTPREEAEKIRRLLSRTTASNGS